jgi:hypothetical protein
MTAKSDNPEKIKKFGIDHDIFLYGERIESFLDLGGGKIGTERLTEAIFLTDQRVIHFHKNKGVHKVVSLSLGEVNAAEVISRGRGYSGYLWWLMSFVAGIMLWQVWDAQPWSPLAAIGVMLVGSYLLIDHMLTSKNIRIVIHAGTSILDCSVLSEDNFDAMQEFVTQIFQLKRGKTGRDDPDPLLL